MLLITTLYISLHQRYCFYQKLCCSFFFFFSYFAHTFDDILRLNQCILRLIIKILVPPDGEI